MGCPLSFPDSLDFLDFLDFPGAFGSLPGLSRLLGCRPGSPDDWGSSGLLEFWGPSRSSRSWVRDRAESCSEVGGSRGPQKTLAIAASA